MINWLCSWMIMFYTVNDYPPSCWDKIPHFRGCEEASKRLARLAEFKLAQVCHIGISYCLLFVQDTVPNQVQDGRYGTGT